MSLKDFYEKYTVVIGLEVHAQLKTKSKAFAPDVNEFGSDPNTNISVITLGHPGVLPKVNEHLLSYAIKMGLALGSTISRYNIFDRKNYFYPDLPKGYQITQDKTPICIGGSVTITMPNKTEKTIGLTRIHAEEDAGKSLHLAGEVETLVDYNRAGVPLIEIVSNPELRSPEEAYAYLTEIRRLVRYLDVCDGNMEEGSMRCDANISIMPKDTTKFGNRVEVKNMNSMRNVQRAIEHEMNRQRKIIEDGGTVLQETRMFDAPTGTTHGMRTKETLTDYRYFPEPDLPPITITEEKIEALKSEMPPLPRALFDKFKKSYKLTPYDAGILADDRETALYFEAVCEHTQNYKSAANYIIGPIKGFLNERTLSMTDWNLEPQKIASIIKLIDDGQISHLSAKDVLLPALIETPEADPAQIAKAKNIIQQSDANSLEPIVKSVLAQHPDKVAAYKGGKKNLIGMFMGQIMKQSKGKADPKAVKELLSKFLDA